MPEEEHKVVSEGTKDKPTIDVGSLTMHVKIYAPFKVYFDGPAHSVSAVNATGPFDILPKHHNFMTLISPCDIVVRTDHGEERVAINRGIMHVKADDVVVFLDV